MILARMELVVVSVWTSLPNRRDRTDEDLSRAPRETPRSLASGLRKTRKVLDLEKAEAMWATKPTATIVRP
jgi:hypothetical protein